MAKSILTSLDLQSLPALDTPRNGSINFAAKSDGLYQKIGTSEEKLLTTNESSYIPLVIGTQTVTTASWTGVLDADSLNSGQTIRYWLPRTSATNVTLNLTLKGGTTTGAIPVYYGGTSRLTTHYPAGSFIMLTYLKDALINGVAYTGWWAKANYADGTESYTVRWNAAIKAGAEITQYKLLVQGSDGKYYPTTIGNTTAGTKTISTVPFLIGSPIIFYLYTPTIAAGGVTSSSYNYTGVTTSTTTYAWNQNSGWRANEDVYLKGTVSGALFTLDNTTLTSHMTQDLPTTEDGFYYMRLGMFTNTTTGFRLSLQHPVYYFADGELQSLNTSNGADWNDIRNLPSTFTPSSHNHPTTDITGLGNIATINKNNSTANYLRGDGSWVTPPNTTYSTATTSANGLMSSTDKSKLDGIALNANNYSLPTASATVLGGVKIGSNISISGGVISVAAPYTHPATHPATIITEDASHRFVTDTEKSTWNAKSNLALGTTSTTAYRGDLGQTAYNYSLVGHLPLAEFHKYKKIRNITTQQEFIDALADQSEYVKNLYVTATIFIHSNTVFEVYGSISITGQIHFRISGDYSITFQDSTYNYPYISLSDPFNGATMYFNTSDGMPHNVTLYIKDDTIFQTAVISSNKINTTVITVGDYTPPLAYGNYVSPSGSILSGNIQQVNMIAQKSELVTTSQNGIMSAADKLKLDGIAAGAKTGTVTSVAMTVPTGLSISGSPITTSGTLALSLTSGYSIPTTAKQSNWDAAHTHSTTSGNPHGTTFAQINSKPTTLAGYGITNAILFDDIIQNTNPFGGRKLYINSLDNALAGAAKKYYVTVTKHKKVVNTITYPKPINVGNILLPQWEDSPVIATYDGDTLFNNVYEGGVACASDEYLKVALDFNAAGTAYFNGYPYGTYLLSYYHTNTPEKAEVRCYNGYAGHTIGYKTLSFSDYIGTNSSGGYIQQCADHGNYQRREIEFIIYGHPSHTTTLTEIEWKLSRPSFPSNTPLFTNYGWNKAYFPLYLGDQATNKIILDPAGYITATTFTGALSGNASTATTLQTARTINGVSFDGSANITITASTPATLTRGSYLTGSNFNGSTATTWAVDATSANTASKVVARDASGNFSAGTITAALSGNATTATTATKLGTASVGSTQLPIYLNAGTATAITQANLRIGLFGTTAIGSTQLPIYLAANGVPTAITQANLRIGLFGATAIGSATAPVYIAANGIATACTSFGGVTGIGTASPLMDGTVAVGTSSLAARQDHRHPVDTSRAAVGQTMYIGTTAVAINRASATLNLAGIGTLAMGGALSGATTIAASTSVTTPKVIFAAAGWSMEQTGTELQFKYNGVVKQRLLSDGSIVGIGEITAFGSTV